VSDSSDRLSVTYHLAVDASEAPARAEEIAREQTVEVPRAVVRERFIEDEVMGRVEAIVADPAGGQRVTIAYSVAATALDPSQLVNVIFGNSSLHQDIACVALEVPNEVLTAMGGPRFGLAGVRKAAGAEGRPMTCTALKPMGRSPEALAELCLDFARAGIDVIKDDHGLADHAFCPFEERVRACLAAVERAADETGHRAVYAPNLSGSPETLFARLDFAEESGAKAVLVSPMLVGLPVFHELCRVRASVPVLAHPAFGGAQRIAHDVLFGQLFRLFGADAVIYVNFGSRFRIERDLCQRLADALRDPWGGLLPALPVPAGGITLENVSEVLAFYGVDTMLLVGGNLQIDEHAVLERSREFVETVRAAASGRE
jgi:ribulose-bisphosphate carboxylase large chain